jgi:disulfide oxidoreductase YuzD
MSRAVIVVGKHFAGKSKTIREYLKPLLGIGINDHKFTLEEKHGYILSQSFEEADRDPDETIKKHSDCDLLVLAARPEEEPASKLPSMRRALSEESFRVNVVRIHNKGQAEEKAQEVFELLAS